MSFARARHPLEQRRAVVLDQIVSAVVEAVMLGNIGSDRRMEFTAIGDPVNIADRLQHFELPT